MSDVYDGESRMSVNHIVAMLSKRWWLIALFMLAGGLLGWGISLTTQAQYRAETVLSFETSMNTNNQMTGSLAGLASLVGLGANSGGSYAVAVEVLKSRDLTAAYISRANLFPFLFSDRWDKEHKKWLVPSERVPTSEQAFRRFEGSVRAIKEDRTTGIIRLSITLPDPVVAAKVANELVADADDKLRLSTISESTANLAYLKSELSKTDFVEIRAAIARLIESEMQKMLLAQSRGRYAFHVLDAAIPPEKPYWPKPLLLIVVGGFLSAVLGGAIAIVLGIRSRRSAQ